MKAKMILGLTMMCSMLMGMQPVTVKAEEMTNAQTAQVESETQE